MSGDVSFDGIAGEFESDIYGSTKGAVRLAVLWRVLNDDVPGLVDQPMRILDAGGGSGHIAVRLARLGHSVVLGDVSDEMLAKAAVRATDAGVADSIELRHVSIQEYASIADEKLDLVLCHAVLEWLDDPKSAVGDLALLVKQGGHLSLMFYNRFASLLKRTFAGDFETALEDYRTGPIRRGWGEGATALDNEMVVSWLEGQGLEVNARAGIRVFHDHVVDRLDGSQGLAQLIELEKAVCRSEPFTSLGQHTHLTCRRVGLPAQDG
ncbi:MAG: methyltransferase domain-containing protein [bacterium]|nr:methyltransferase domain-containing protein [bacterium]